MAEPKITKHDILKASEGMLQKQLYVVFTRPTNGLAPVMEHIDEHLKFQVQLEKDGIMFGAGPFWADNEVDWHGEGMVVIRADSLAHAKEIAARDPMHESGARSYEVRPWLLNEGTLTIRIDYSSGKRDVT